MPDPARVLVLAPNWLGDAVMALPALEDVRRWCGEAHLIVAARASVARLFTLVPCVDQVLELGWRGRLSDVGAMRRDMASLRACAADVALVLPGSFATAWLAKGARVPERWGVKGDARAWLLTRSVARPAGSVHQGAYFQYLVRSLGIPNGPLEPRVAVPDEAVREARALLADRGWDGERPLVVCAAGAAYGTAKQWLPEHFASLLARLVSECGVHGVLVGSAADADTSRRIVGLVPDACRARLSDLSGHTSLATLAGVLAVSRACVSNDSGAMHLAAAAGAPVVAVFGPTREHETAPLARQGVPVRVLVHPVSCRPCMLRECPIDHPCMRDLEPARVYAEVRDVLSRGLP